MSATQGPQQPDFDALWQRLYRLCLALTGRADDAAEAAQEALVRAWSRRHRRREGVTWWSWAAGFAIRTTREMGHARPRHTHGALSTELPAAEPVLADTRLAALRDAIRTLPPRQREVVVLRFVIGHSTRDTAVVLGCAEGTVKSHLFKAVATLRARLQHLESCGELPAVPRVRD